MRDKRFIIIKINSPSIAYSVIDGRSMSFYDNNGNNFRSIDLSMMLEEIIDIPVYFKLMFEKGMDAAGYTAETESMDLADYCNNMNPYMHVPRGITRTAGPEIINIFDLDDHGMMLQIQVVPQINGLYYNFTIANYNRLVMDIIASPVDMLYVDAEHGYMHTMEIGHEKMPFDPYEIIKFLHPEIEDQEFCEKRPNNRVFFV